MKNEIKVGIVIFLALVSMFVVVFFLKDLRFGISGKYYIVQFENLNNLMEGGHVKLNGGIRIGKVTKLKIDGMFANVHFVITDSDIVLTDTASFSISGAGLLGEKYLFVLLGKGGEPIKENTKLKGKKAQDLDSIIPKVAKIADSINNILDNQLYPTLEQIKIYVNGKEIKEILKNVLSSSKNLNKLMDNSNKLVLDIKDKHVKKTMDNVNETILLANSEIKKLSTSIQSFVSKTDGYMNKFFSKKDGVLTITKESSTVLKEVKKFVAKLNKIAKNLDDEKTPLGAMFKSKKMTKNINKLIKNLNELVIEVKNSPLISNKKKYRPGPF